MNFIFRWAAMLLAGLAMAGAAQAQLKVGDNPEASEIWQKVRHSLFQNRAISTAGGIARAELDARLMLRRRPGVFAAGEMLDWEAPTGGYLLQGCMATGFAAGHGVIDWLREPAS